jgi:hypothetical protein
MFNHLIDPLLLQAETRTILMLAPSVLNCSSWTSSKGNPLLIQCYYRRNPKLTLFILDGSVSSKLFYQEVQYGSSLIDPGYYRRKPKLTLFFLDISISSKLLFLEFQ